MEKVQNVVKNISQFGDEDDHGNKAYWINFTDGSKGIFRTPDQNLFIEGQEAEYAIKEMKHSEKAGDYAILQRYKEDYIPGKKVENTFKSAENIEQINRSVAIKAACQLYQASKTDREYVLETAEMFFDYIKFGITDSNNKEQEALPPSEAPTDTLPF